ncbi:MAG: RDD family protein [Promethearchaeota archaeon]
MALKFCPKCGNELEPDSSFCDSCGVDLRDRPEKSKISIPAVSEPIQASKIKQEPVVYADFFRRLVALIIDSLIIGLISFTISWIFIHPWYRYDFFDPFQTWWFTFPFDWLFGLLYHWCLETYNNGQTLGKMALNIRTVDENTFQSTSSGNYALNNIFKGSAFLLLDFILGILKNSGEPEKRVRIMQNVSETVVIMTK